MNHRNPFVTSLAAMAVIAWVSLSGLTARAQPMPPEPPLEPPPAGFWGDIQGLDDDASSDAGDVTAQRQRIQERLRILRAWRLTETIEMDDATSIQVFELLDRYDGEMNALQGRLSEASRQLRRHLEQATGTPEAVSALVDEITSTHLLIEQARVTLIRDVAAYLEPRQRAAFMLFLPEFEQEVRQMMHQARRQRRGQRQQQSP